MCHLLSERKQDELMMMCQDDKWRLKPGKLVPRCDFLTISERKLWKLLLNFFLMVFLNKLQILQNIYVTFETRWLCHRSKLNNLNQAVTLPFNYSYLLQLISVVSKLTVFCKFSSRAWLLCKFFFLIYSHFLFPQAVLLFFYSLYCLFHMRKPNNPKLFPLLCNLQPS